MTQTFRVLEVFFEIIQTQLPNFIISLLNPLNKASKSNENGQSSKTQSSGLGLHYFNCGESGHQMTECKKERKYSKNLFVSTEESEGYQEEETEEFIEELTFDSSGSARFVEEHGDNRPMLIVNRAFFIPKGQDKDKWFQKKYFSDYLYNWEKNMSYSNRLKQLRESYFRGSCNETKFKNRISSNFVQAHMLKKKCQVTVSRRCLVSLSIGSIYKDQIWCNVVIVDACHLLLGRPWQSD